MVRIKPSTATVLFFIILLVTASPSQSLSYSQYRSLFSLAHSLMKRVANLRAARGDIEGSERAQRMVERLERGLGLGFWGFMWSAGWDYAKNYSWRNFSVTELYGAVSEMNELLRYFGELTRKETDVDRVAWVRRNYQKVLSICNSLFGRLLSVFRQSGVLREVVETVQREVVEGGLLMDCLELGSNDLKGLIQIIKDMALQLCSATNSHPDL
ncbi:Adenine phosphoribosyltransferase [Quillaja saponaria]|uniref:Adenine phosphoribosyltransferase n=1 Tax=Quillaja saponaria TaxID=32244 RepID=A0AAD7M2W7_QUISA|nr:Adenine phosphoribosyltransferase [Quillaja saponaria]